MNRVLFGCTMFQILLIWGNSAHAYLDPGSTSMIWQMLLVALASVVVFFKFFWHKLSSLFGQSNKKRDNSKPSESEDSQK
jgi:hypothetical protein